MAFALNEFRFKTERLVESYWADTKGHESTVIKIALVWIAAISIAMYVLVMGYVFIQNKDSYSQTETLKAQILKSKLKARN